MGPKVFKSPLFEPFLWNYDVFLTSKYHSIVTCLLNFLSQIVILVFRLRKGRSSKKCISISCILTVRKKPFWNFLWNYLLKIMKWRGIQLLPKIESQIAGIKNSEITKYGDPLYCTLTCNIPKPQGVLLIVFPDFVPSRTFSCSNI